MLKNAPRGGVAPRFAGLPDGVGDFYATSAGK